MIFRTHIAFALLVGLLGYNYFVFVDTWILYFLFLFLGAGIPDVDHSKSKFGRNIFSRIIVIFSKHRKIFHSLFFGMLVAYLLFLYDKGAGFGFLLGFFSHVVLDSFTKQGINFLYPVGEFKVRGFVKSGGILETFLFYFLVILDTVSFLTST